MTTVPSLNRAAERTPPLLAAFQAARRLDPYPAYHAIRESDPLPGAEVAGRRITLVTRHSDAAVVLQSPAFGHGYRENISPFRPAGDPDDGLESLLRTDPPDHTRLRRLVSGTFTPTALTALAPEITAYASTLLDAALAAGEIDAVTALAAPVPMRMICRLLGVPASDETAFGEWAAILIRCIDPDFLLTPDDIAQRRWAARELDDYFRDLIARVRADPGDDLLSQLVATHLEAGALTGSEVLALCAVLLVAGHETTVNLLAGGILALARHPKAAALARAEPGLVPAAVEEMLRHDSPVQFIPRTALRDIEVGGYEFRRGEGALVLVGSANRDPDVFDEPDRFLVTRYAGATPAARHFSFGMGIHYCLGAPLARMEATIIFRLLLDRTSDIELTEEPAYRDQSVIRGPRALSVRLVPRR